MPGVAESARCVSEQLSMLQGCNAKQICPFFQWNDKRCAERFNLQRLHKVFDECLGDYTRCSIYRQLAVNHREHENRPRASIAASQSSADCRNPATA